MDNKACFTTELKDTKEMMKIEDDLRLVSSGRIKGEIISKLLNYCDTYEHIEIQECIYSDDHTNLEWIDVEGIDYGWAWMRFEDDLQGLREYLASKVRHVLNDILNNKFEDDVYYIHLESDKYKWIKIINQNNDDRLYSYKFSDEELYFI